MTDKTNNKNFDDMRKSEGRMAPLSNKMLSNFDDDKNKDKDDGSEYDWDFEDE